MSQYKTVLARSRQLLHDFELPKSWEESKPGENASSRDPDSLNEWRQVQREKSGRSGGDFMPRSDRRLESLA